MVLFTLNLFLAGYVLYLHHMFYYIITYVSTRTMEIHETQTKSEKQQGNGVIIFPCNSAFLTSIINYFFLQGREPHLEKLFTTNPYFRLIPTLLTFPG